MNIGEVAERSGIPPKTIRYYEDIGLVRPQRSGNGYRAFRETDLHKLAFLGRARALGFSIEDCRNLLNLYEDEDRAASGHARDLVPSRRGLPRRPPTGLPDLEGSFW